MSENTVVSAGRALQDGVGLLRAAVGCSASEEQRIAGLSLCESLARQLEQLQIELIAGLVHEGVFADRGYRSAVQEVADLLGCDTAVARRRVRVADDICPRRSLDGQVLAARLSATGVVFAAGEIGLRHVEVIAEALRSPAARRLSPQVWAGAEEKLAEQAASYRPAELAVFAHDLISMLDQDGPWEREDEPEQVNELHLSMRTGKVKGWLDGLTRELLATALDALCLPRGPEDERTARQRRADALGEVCARVLDSGQLPRCGGERPHLNVIIRSPSWSSGRGRRALISGPGCRRRICGCWLVMRGWCRSCWAGRGNPWMSGGPGAPSPRGCAGRSPPATVAAPNPGAGARRHGARSTI